AGGASAVVVGFGAAVGAGAASVGFGGASPQAATRRTTAGSTRTRVTFMREPIAQVDLSSYPETGRQLSQALRTDAHRARDVHRVNRLAASDRLLLCQAPCSTPPAAPPDTRSPPRLRAARLARRADGASRGAGSTGRSSGGGARGGNPPGAVRGGA